MKVLFAVSSESISEAIIKRYQKEYKEILSYKNVYYFNAILKEIQKDKTYDRIIISEDLEPFSNNNYDTIDKFIFEKLDSISDEAQDSSGKETSIILICTDRRVKGNSILVKLFGIGVYNALLGNDRSMDEVCKLINRPRTKKEAKMYYRIDTDDVSYKAENENEVSEIEIQNILAHFKKLGKNTAKYSDSFNNIAVQYTDEQLKIIVNCLPINVKAVLEENCERYQELMAVTGTIRSVKGIVSSNIEGAIKNEINERKIGQASKITKPIVIPSAVRNAKNTGKPVVRKAPTVIPEQTEEPVKPAQKPMVRPVARAITDEQNVQKNENSAKIEDSVLPAFEDFYELEKQNAIENETKKDIENTVKNTVKNVVKKVVEKDIKNTVESTVKNAVKKVAENDIKNTVESTVKNAVKKVAENDIKNTVESTVKNAVKKVAENDIKNTVESTVKNAVKKVTENTVRKDVKNPEENTSKKVVENDIKNTIGSTVKNAVKKVAENDIKNTVESTVKNAVKKVTENTVRKDVKNPEENTSKKVVKKVAENETQNAVENKENIAKRGRGRPKKTIVSGVEVKPKGKRGRPRKAQEETVELEEPMLPGIDFEEKIVVEDILPGIDFEENEEIVKDILPGIDFEEEEVVEEEDILPGIDFEEDEVEEEEDVLPGIDFEEEVVEEEDILPGINFEEDEVEDDEDILTGIDFEKDEVEDDEDILTGIDFEEDEVVEEEDVLPGIDFEEDEVVEEEDVLPGIDFEEDEVEEEEDILLETDFEEDDEVVEEEEEYTEEVNLPSLDELDDLEFESTEEDSIKVESNDNLLSEIDLEEEVESSEEMLPGFTKEDESNDEFEEETLLPGMGFEDENDLDDMIPGISAVPESAYESNSLESIKPRVDYSMSSLNSLITKDKKIVTFIGTSKNGTSFLVNNLAALFSSLGINTAILDMTQNKNSYYIYTKNEEELRTIAFNSIEKLQNGYAEGIRVDKNLTVYTALPNDGKDYSNAEPILSTLVQNHSLILIDCDYDTDMSYFASCQEMYLVQSMDILTIQPLTAFLRELKTKGILEPEKIRVVVNKELRVRSLSIKAILGGLAYYNDPAMSFMTELFNRDLVKACTIPFEDNVYSKYLEGIVNCSISLNGYSKQFLSKLKILGDMVYPLTSKQSYNRATVDYSQNNFSNSMNDTLNKMRKKY